MYLFEDAELKTIFNMAELVKELEPEPLIETEDTDPSAGEEKRKIISQMASYSLFVLAICLCMSVTYLLVPSKSRLVLQCLQIFVMVTFVSCIVSCVCTKV